MKRRTPSKLLAAVAELWSIMLSTIHSLQALEHAILYGDCRAMMSLLDACPEWINARFADNLNLTPLMWAARNRRDSLVAVLLERGANVSLTNGLEDNTDGTNTALWFTGQGATAGTTGIAARLIAAGAEVNTRCEHGQTALYIAAAWAHLDLVQLLLSLGADAAIPDDGGKTPLAMLKADVAWCDRQSSLKADQKRFRERAPRLVAFLEEVTAVP